MLGLQPKAFIQSQYFGGENKHSRWIWVFQKEIIASGEWQPNKDEAIRKYSSLHKLLHQKFFPDLEVRDYDPTIEQ